MNIGIGSEKRKNLIVTLMLQENKIILIEKVSGRKQAYVDTKIRKNINDYEKGVTHYFTAYYS
jgi:ribosomal protein L6P/L9E